MQHNPTYEILAAQPWAMSPVHLTALLGAVRAIRADGPQAPLVARGAPLYDVRDGVAHLAIKGPMLKEVPAIFEWLGIAATCTPQVQAAVEAAVYDSAVRAIELAIDSPGGTVAGTQELADTVSAAASLKPVVARVSDLAASAAYWVASQATAIEANAGAQVGSIGVYSVLADSSAAAAEAGVKVHVVRSHGLKGAGVAGSEVTPDQIADAQRIVDGAASQFVAAVARGRNMSLEATQAVATGQTWFAPQALDMGLIDNVRSVGVAHSAPAGAGTVGAPIAGALENITMAQEVEGLASAQALAKEAQAKAASAEGEVAALREALKAAKAEQRSALVDKYADRVAPAMRASALSYGEFCGDDLGKFEAFLKALPVVARSERVSDQSLSPAAHEEPDAGAAQVAKWLGISAQRIEQLSQVKGWLSDGTYVLQDDSQVTREQLQKLTH